MNDRRFSIGTVVNQSIPDDVSNVARAIAWLVARQNGDGTWGGSDNLDRFICTTHSVMTLLCIGVAPTSSLVARAMAYLATIDQEKNLSFFWRSGVFCKLPGYSNLVKEDIEYIWRYRRRVAVHKDYPVLFFLLKLLRFTEGTVRVPFSSTDVLKIIIEDFDPKVGWYDKTSITSMALALLFDMRFKGRDDIIAKGIRYLQSRYTALDAGTGRFSDNLVEELFLIFNLCERPFLRTAAGARLRKPVASVAKRLRSLFADEPFVTSPPPFGGSIDEKIYPTAVAVRAIVSHASMVDKAYFQTLAPAVIDAIANSPRADLKNVAPFPSFWGSPDLGEAPQCFVLMPFEQKLTDIYERYIKVPIESTCKIKCIRADDIYKPTHIMKDIWDHICRSAIIIADMTHKNPNVFYELGLSHAIGKRVVLLSQSTDDIPFDLRSVRTIIYRDSPSGYEQLREQVVRFVRDSLP